MDQEQFSTLEKLAQKKDYGRGLQHATQVAVLSLRLYRELVRLGFMLESERTERLLRAAALLHDTGLPREPHNEAGFDALKVEIPKVLAARPLPLSDLSTLLYCVLWHRGNTFENRGLVIRLDTLRVKKMACIIRVADALDRSLRQNVSDLRLNFNEGILVCTVQTRGPVEIEISRAEKKADLMKMALGFADIRFQKESASTEPVATPSPQSHVPIRVLLVCGGNTCRSPMAKIILQQKLRSMGKLDEFEVDSAGYDGPGGQAATQQAREAMMAFYGEDSLSQHHSKKLTPDLMGWADLILVMAPRMKVGLPPGKTYTLKEYAGKSGDIPDPYGGDLAEYIKVAEEIKASVDVFVVKLYLKHFEDLLRRCPRDEGNQ